METYNKIRLTDRYISVIKKLAKKYFDSESVIIFGSRTDPNRRGGDIDILIRTNRKNDILESKLAFLRDFVSELGEQSVDLIVKSDKDERKIFKEALKEGIEI